jgi:peptidyl-prolyl cis-trans isomerase B (cyclophilin B)
VSSNPVVNIEMNSGKNIKVELYPDVAPNTVKNFISLVNKGYYDGLIFHRVINGFMIQGGCPDKNGMGGPGYSIKGEFAINGFENLLKHSRGVISMARSQSPNSGGSQFFLMHKDSPHLDNQYAGFGKIVEGIEVVDEIADVAIDHSDRPREEQIMVKVTVELNDYKFEEPETI